MNEIVAKEEIAPDTYRYEVRHPKIARKRKAGQFVILRVHEGGERFPLTIVDSDPDEGTVTLIFQAVGHSTKEANSEIRSSAHHGVACRHSDRGRSRDRGNRGRAWKTAD